MKFNFEDTGTTTTDSVSGVVLKMVDSTGTNAVDLHSILGLGVGNTGKCLDLSTASAQGSTGPLAFTTNNTTITFGTLSNFTVTMWINPISTLLTAGYARFFSMGTNGDADRDTTNTFQLLNNGAQYTGGATNSAQVYVNLTQSSPTAFGAMNMPINAWTFMALNYDGTNLSLYAGSTSATTTLQARTNFAAGTVKLPGAFSLMLGNNIAGTAGIQSRAFQGYIDNVRFYTGGATNTSNFLESVRLSESPPFAPGGVIGLGCNSQAALSWNSSVGATNYIVERGTSTGGETNYVTTNGLSFTDTNVTIGSTYYYEIAATNSVGSTPSSEIAVTISGSGSLNVISGPSNTTVCDGSTAFLMARASGPSISYDWQLSQDGGMTWLDYESGTTLSNFTTYALSAASDNGDLWRVIISNPCGAIIPTPALITVNAGVTITNEPVSQTTGTNWPATFTVGVSGSSPIYQWQENGVNLTNGPNVFGATNATLILSNLTTGSSGANITCLVGSPCSSPVATSPPAVLTVVTNPLQFRFQFADETNTTSTTDSVAGVVMECVDATGAPVDLHGAIGTGVNGNGRALNFTSGLEGSTGPVAFSSNSPINFGTISAFTVTLWVEPETNMYVAFYPRFFTLGAAGTGDRGVANSIGMLSDGAQTGTGETAFQEWVNTTEPSVTSFGLYNMPSNVWQFLAMTYDGVTLDAYAGSTTNSVALVSSIPFPAGTVTLGNSWILLLGNTYTGATVGSQVRSLQGYLDDVRFYLGAAPSNALETIRAQLAPLPPAATTISSTVNGTNLVLTYGSTGGGHTYILESATNLNSPVTWTPIVTNPGTGGTITNIVPLNPNKPQQFLRYQAQ
jgi:hypothetical protein